MVDFLATALLGIAPSDSLEVAGGGVSDDSRISVFSGSAALIENICTGLNVEELY